MRRHQGDCYLLDLDSGERGTAGQIVFRPDVPGLDEPLVPSLTAFLVRAAGTEERTLVLC